MSSLDSSVPLTLRGLLLTTKHLGKCGDMPHKANIDPPTAKVINHFIFFIYSFHLFFSFY